ncbi:hypothetical protein ACVW0K_003741 [Streptomyces filamentosus]
MHTPTGPRLALTDLDPELQALVARHVAAQQRARLRQNAEGALHSLLFGGAGGDHFHEPFTVHARTPQAPEAAVPVRAARGAAVPAAAGPHRAARLTASRTAPAPDPSLRRTA